MTLRKQLTVGGFGGGLISGAWHIPPPCCIVGVRQSGGGAGKVNDWPLVCLSGVGFVSVRGSFHGVKDSVGLTRPQGVVARSLWATRSLSFGKLLEKIATRQVLQQDSIYSTSFLIARENIHSNLI